MLSMTSLELIHECMPRFELADVITATTNGINI